MDINHEVAVHMSEGAIGDVPPIESQHEISGQSEPTATSAEAQSPTHDVIFKSSGRLLVALSK